MIWIFNTSKSSGFYFLQHQNNDWMVKSLYFFDYPKFCDCILMKKFSINGGYKGFFR